LPAYELAMMTAREVRGMGLDPEITILTPELDPLGLFGSVPRRRSRMACATPACASCWA
jgi:hypothetical protein